MIGFFSLLLNCIIDFIWVSQVSSLSFFPLPLQEFNVGFQIVFIYESSLISSNLTIPPSFLMRLAIEGERLFCCFFLTVVFFSIIP